MSTMGVYFLRITSRGFEETPARAEALPPAVARGLEVGYSEFSKTSHWPRNELASPVLIPCARVTKQPTFCSSIPIFRVAHGM